MNGGRVDSERLRVIRELIVEAEMDQPHTAYEATQQHGAVSYLRRKLEEAGRVILSGD